MTIVTSLRESDIKEDTDLTENLIVQSRTKTLQGKKSSQLTYQELQVMQEILSGSSNLDIAEILSISLNTVKDHIANIYKKLEIDNRFQAILWAATNF